MQYVCTVSSHQNEPIISAFGTIAGCMPNTNEKFVAFDGPSCQKFYLDSYDG